MTIKEKKQAFLLIAVLALMLIAGLIILRNARRPIAPTATPRAHEVLQDSASLTLTPDRLASADTPATLDSNTQTFAPATISPRDNTHRFQLPAAPALSDTLRRYGSHATTMQMLIELLEEKQLLLEEKVELARRLEIAEILDSALTQTDAPSLSASAAWDSLLSSQLDSLSYKLPMPDSRPNENPPPPRP